MSFIINFNFEKMMMFILESTLRVLISLVRWCNVTKRNMMCKKACHEEKGEANYNVPNTTQWQ
jgi:hypothetical protein